MSDSPDRDSLSITTRHCCTILPTAEQQRDTASLGMWLFLATEIMFFGGMFCAYLVYRYWYYNEFAAGSRSIGHLAGHHQYCRSDLQQLDGSARASRLRSWESANYWSSGCSGDAWFLG